MLTASDPVLDAPPAGSRLRLLAAVVSWFKWRSATLAVCLPTKAVSGWFHGAIPVVCFSHYRGIADWINGFGIGFVLRDWADVRRLRDDRAAIARTTDRCMAVRDRFSSEWNAARIHEFVKSRLAQKLRRPQQTETQPI